MRTKLLVAACLLVILQTSCQKDNNKQQSRTYTVNEATSKVGWIGAAPTHFHIGSFDVEGEFSTDANGVISAGGFTIPITSIENYDLDGEEKIQLLSHLKSAAFFDIALHPNARFNITSVDSYAGNDPDAVEGANAEVKGTFQMLGETHPLSFPAKIWKTGDSLYTEATFKLNRLTWGMDSFSDPNGSPYILPDVQILLDLKAARNK